MFEGASRRIPALAQLRYLGNRSTSELHISGAAKPGGETAQGAGDQVPRGFGAGKMPGASGGAAPAAPDTAARAGPVRQVQQPG